MFHTLVHIYGPFGIHSYGVLFAFGIVFCLYFAKRTERRKKLMSAQTFIDAIIFTVIIGLIGSRILFIIQEWGSFESWVDYINIWSGGLSLLGSIPAIVIFLPLYLRRHNIPYLQFCDLITLWAPLLQSISRLGCFFAGCCFGTESSVPWAVTYYDYESIAPLCVALHPAQLYSSIFLLLIFLFFYFVAQYRYTKPGSIMLLYMICISLERFLIDFFRGDREFFSWQSSQMFSMHQLIALTIFVASLLGWLYLQFGNKLKRQTA